MKKIILGLMLFLSITTVSAEEQQTMPDAIYLYPNMFLDGALLFRPKGTEDLRLINMQTAIISVVKLGDCMQIFINTEDGWIEGPCVKPSVRVQKSHK